MNLTFKQIRYYTSVIEAGSIRKAAEKLGVSQPSISAQIIALEKALDTNLLERSRNGSIPTALGRSMLPAMQQMLQANHKIINIARNYTNSPGGTYRLGVPHTLGPYLLPEVIPKIHQIYPSLRFFVKEDTPHNLQQDLLQGSYDIILTPLALEVGNLSYSSLFTEPLCVVSSPDHRLANKKNIKPKDFKGENFLVLEDRHRFFLNVQKLAQKYGFNLLRDYEGTSLDTLRLMIGTGLGLSFLPSLYVRSEISQRNDVILLNAGFPLPKREVVLAWRRESTQIHFYKALADIIRKNCRDNLSDFVEVTKNTNKSLSQ